MQRFRRHSPRGFTLLELLVVIGMFCLLMAFFLAFQTKSDRTNNRVRCASNLRQIGQGLTLYANENNGLYPRTGYSPDAPVPDLTNLGYNCTDPFDSTSTLDGKNNVPSVLYLLARTENINMRVFVCDLSDAQVMSFNVGGVLNHCNFAQVPGGGTLGNLSYSIENPYPGTEAIGDGWRWNNTISSDYAVAADLNPGRGGGQDPTAVNITSSAKQMQVGNSLNHRAIGQNVLFGDGHVDFEFQPMCGVLRDCIYTQGGTRVINSPCVPNSSIIVGPPNSRDDSVLLPTQY